MKEANQILHFSAKLDDRSKMIAEYWADGPSTETPPGHWNLFAQAVSDRDAHTLDDGIHFESGDLAGRKLGRRIGQLVWSAARQHFDGHTLPW